MMAKSAGDWKAEVTQYMDPTQPPTKTQSKVHNEMIMGGRYLSTKWSGDMMGMPFEGISTLGFDNARKLYVSTWIDNMGTGIMNMEGTLDAATNTITFNGKMVNGETLKEEPVRETFTIMDKDHQLMQMYGVGKDGKEFKSMQIHYTRKK